MHRKALDVVNERREAWGAPLERRSPFPRLGKLPVPEIVAVIWFLTALFIVLRHHAYVVATEAQIKQLQEELHIVDAQRREAESQVRVLQEWKWYLIETLAGSEALREKK